MVHLAATGAVMPEVLEASGELAEEGALPRTSSTSRAPIAGIEPGSALCDKEYVTATTPSVPGALRGAFSRSRAYRHHPRWCEPLAGVAWLGDGGGGGQPRGRQFRAEWNRSGSIPTVRFDSRIHRQRRFGCARSAVVTTQSDGAQVRDSGVRIAASVMLAYSRKNGSRRG